MSAVARFVRGSRRIASNSGRNNGSNLLSRCTRDIDASPNQFKSVEPVLVSGMGRSGLDRTVMRRKLQRKVNGLVLVPIQDAQVDSRTDLADFVANVFGNE